MKKSFLIVSLLFIFLTGCNESSNDEVPPTIDQNFILDNRTFSLLGNQGITEYLAENVLAINGFSYNRSTLTITGLNGIPESGIVSFDLYYKAGMSIAGTYTIYADDDDTNFDEFLGPLNRGCMGWLTTGVIFPLSSSSNQIRTNNPTGTIQVIANSPNNYTITYTGNFRVYDDSFNFIRNAPTSINITNDVVQF